MSSEHTGNDTKPQQVIQIEPEQLGQIVGEVVSREIIAIRREEYFSGPLPPSAEFERYEKACPGAARDILDMAKTEQNARISAQNSDIEARTRLIEGELKFKRDGQYIAAVISAFCIAICILALYLQYPWVSIAALTAISTIAYVFISGRKHKENKNSDEKQESVS